jgi:hypothetical protein
MLNIAISAWERGYQLAAAQAAATYAAVMGGDATVNVYLPQGEPAEPELLQRAGDYDYGIRNFRVAASNPAKQDYFQLRCQAFLAVVGSLQPGQLLLIVDGDTYCIAPIAFSRGVQKQILQGKIGAVPDVKDSFIRDASSPLYIPVESGAVYVNVGVILASRRSLDIFKRVANLATKKQYRSGPYHEQCILNYVLGAQFHDRVVYLGKRYNGVGRYFNRDTIIGHRVGGVGGMNEPGSRRLAVHERKCRKVLERYESFGI